MDYQSLYWLWSSLIGVAGTIVGALLGYFLSKRRKHKLITSLTSFNVGQPNYSHNYSNGKDKFDSVHVMFELYVYNPSDYVKVFRNLSFLVFAEDKCKYYFPITNLEDHYLLSDTIPVYRKFAVQNIPQNIAVLYKCAFYIFENNFEIFKNSKKNIPFFY